MKLAFVVVLLVTMMATADEDEGCFCVAWYNPVCGVDGRTYSNSCQAGCAKVGVAYEGECKNNAT